MTNLRDFTTARVALGRAGNGLPTSVLLDLRLAHARARDAVHWKLDSAALAAELSGVALDSIVLRTQSRDRASYLRNPELGKRLSAESVLKLRDVEKGSDLVIAIADGLSALAVHRHAPRVLAHLLPGLRRIEWNIAPLMLVEQGRVAIGDEIGEEIGAAIALVLIGERPGLSSPDSLGAYLTWSPRRSRTDAERNCISNIRTEGLPYEAAAIRLLFLLQASRTQMLSGVSLKETVGLNLAGASVPPTP